MANQRSDRSPKVLRRIAAFLIRSPNARFVLDDLDELLERDLARGLPAWRARWRYGRNALTSAWSVRRAPTPGPRIPLLAAASWLDVKLGLRMLVKYPGVSLVGGLGIALAVAIGTGFFDVAAVVHAPLPFEEGDRIVAIENWDIEQNDQERRILHDFLAWRSELTAVEELGAYRWVTRNLIVPGGETDLVPAAEMTASGFAMTRVRPLLGRPLLEEDEEEGAPPVVVIGHDVWRTRFESDPSVVGQEVRLGSTVHTVVGVMPEGFAFPISHHVWVPFRFDAVEHERREGPAIYVFGRLAPGATLESAQAELTTLARRMASAYPQTHRRLRPRVMPYTIQLYGEMEGVEIPAMQILIIVLLVVVCVNVAILVYARTATRQGEIAVRNALGASRRRVVSQLFVEALVFSGVAAIAGLVVARVVLRYLDGALTMLVPFGIPFWIEFKLSAGTIAYTLGLTVLAALIVGALPAFQATGRKVQSELQRRAAGISAMGLGRSWTTLVIVQVAIAVAILPGAAFHTWQFLRYGSTEPGYGTEEFLTAELSLERDLPGRQTEEDEADERESRFAALQAELVRRLQAEADVSEAILTFGRPGEEGSVWIEVEGMPTPAKMNSAVREGSSGHRVGTGRVPIGFFDAFDVPVIAGRLFHQGDLAGDTSAVVANQAFVNEIVGGGNALGQRVRYVGRSGDVNPGEIEFVRWYEIVGVVETFPNSADPQFAGARIYHPAGADVAYGMINVRVRGDEPTTFAARLREVAASLDPRLQLRDISRLDTALRQEHRAMQLGAFGIASVTLSVLLLAGAGIYTLMSFAVSRRQREIGIRAALGAHPRRILAAIFSRALLQLAIGMVVGLLAAAALDPLTGGELLGGKAAVLLPAVSGFMMVVGLLAAVGPARRGLRIQPREALRADT